MALQLSVSVRNARLDAIEEAIGESPILKIRSGDKPANCASADSGTVLAEMILPANWLANASGGTVQKLGAWQELDADSDGTAGHFRLYASNGFTCHMQGAVTVQGGGGEMEVESVLFIESQRVRVTTFVLTDGNA